MTAQQVLDRWEQVQAQRRDKLHRFDAQINDLTAQSKALKAEIERDDFSIGLVKEQIARDSKPEDPRQQTGSH